MEWIGKISIFYQQNRCCGTLATWGALLWNIVKGLLVKSSNEKLPSQAFFKLKIEHLLIVLGAFPPTNGLQLLERIIFPVEFRVSLSGVKNL